MVIGFVKWFNSAKGYGFLRITGDIHDTDYFVHYSDICGDGFRELAEGQAVRFQPKAGPKGLAAMQVEIVRAQP